MENIVIKFIVAIMCHMVGDYVLQCDFIAKTKSENWYHLFVHVVLYCVPFAIIFGINYGLGVIFFTHIRIDALKINNKITYTQDQMLHYAILFAICLL